MRLAADALCVDGFFVSFCFFFDSGYRSIHLNVRLKGDKRVVEIQLRALEHHNWATLVEITDLLFRTKLKELGTKSG